MNILARVAALTALALLVAASYASAAASYAPTGAFGGMSAPVGGDATADARTGAPNCDLPAPRVQRRAVLVYLQKENYDRGRYFPRDLRIYVPVAKRITDVEAWSPLRTALLRLMEGKTRRERRLGCGSIFSNDAHVLRAVKIVDGQAVVDFHRRAFRKELAFVSTSHAGAVFVTQLNLTILQFPNVHSIRYEFGGNCNAFGVYMQAGECMIFRRAGVGLAG